MKRQITAVILTLLIVLGSTPAAFAETSTTVPASADADNSINLLNATPYSQKILQAHLKTIAAKKRMIGSKGEKAAVSYIATQLKKYGCTVTKQNYKYEGKTGQNVIGVRKASVDNADILIISAHHDTVQTAYGASDNGSGVACLLAAADVLEDKYPELEIRFISFTGEEEGKLGSRYYVSKLSSKTKARIIADVQVDMVGGLGGGDLVIGTSDGMASSLSDAITEAATTVIATVPALKAETASDHSSFAVKGIPSAVLTQKNSGYFYHSLEDKYKYIDYSQLQEVISILEVLPEHITKSSALDNAYTQTLDNVILFSDSKANTEGYLGMSGTLIDSHTEVWDSFKDVYKTYRYPMKWFGLENTFDTDYTYRNNYLENVEIQGGTLSYDDLFKAISAMYGKPVSTSDEAGIKGAEWEDKVYTKYISLNEENGACTIGIMPYMMGVAETLAEYDVTGGIAKIDNPSYEKIWSLVTDIFPAKALNRIDKLIIFQDGYRYKTAFACPSGDSISGLDNRVFQLNIDYNDVFDEKGEYRDYSKTVGTIIHEYGHVLTLDDNQIDLTTSKKTSLFYDHGTWVKGAYLPAFYKKFWKGTENGGPLSSSFVTEYASNNVYEDIADSFRYFVLAKKPLGNSISCQKIKFFYDYPELVELRSDIRKNLDLD